MSQVFLNMFSGDTRRFRVAIQDTINNTSTPYDLAAAANITLSIAAFETPSQAVLTKSFNAAAVTEGLAAEGIVRLTITQAESATVPPGKCVLQIRVIEQDGDGFTVVNQVFDMLQVIQ